MEHKNVGETQHECTVLKEKEKYTNPARGIDFCKQKLWPLPCSQLTN